MLRANSCVAKEAACKFLKKIILTLEAFVSALSSNACSLFLCWFNSFCSSTDSDRGELLSKLKLCIVFHTKALFYITRSQLGCPASSQSCTGSREAFQQMVPFGSQLLQMRSWQLSSREIQVSLREGQCKAGFPPSWLFTVSTLIKEAQSVAMWFLSISEFKFGIKFVF